eukprot:TRINITY_DN4149_c0_g2_i1.p1 TRINITY_DN4149_c0_g2~~TRINITY_DN4149_c0_g2_i1.p1  ORF type:complete len:363 (-),score=57.44 TRINITY_DN4149_c0_g2_i1:240-1328(-)
MKKKLMIVILTMVLCSFFVYFFLYEKENFINDKTITEFDLYKDYHSPVFVDNFRTCENDIKEEIKLNHHELYRELCSLEEDLVKYKIKTDSCYLWDLVPQKIYNASEPDIASLFVHIRKTGGTSFSTFLTNTFECDCPEDFNGYWKFHNKCNCDKNLHDLHNILIRGSGNYHMTLDTLSYLFQEQHPNLTPKYIILFREPISLFYSTYKHCSTGYCFKYFKDGEERSVEEFIDYIGETFYNEQVKTLLLPHVSEEFNEPYLSNSNLILTHAKIKLLEKITFFGINEYFYNSTRLFVNSASFDDKHGENVHINDARHSAHSLTPDVVSFLESKLDLDLKFYDFANLLLKFRLKHTLNIDIDDQ